MAFVTFIQMETVTVGSITRYYVMAVTPTRLYSFTGIGSLDVSKFSTRLFSYFLFISETSCSFYCLWILVQFHDEIFLSRTFEINHEKA